jgi:hypothetical protein
MVYVVAHRWQKLMNIYESNCTAEVADKLIFNNMLSTYGKIKSNTNIAISYQGTFMSLETCYLIG